MMKRTSNHQIAQELIVTLFIIALTAMITMSKTIVGIQNYPVLFVAACCAALVFLSNAGVLFLRFSHCLFLISTVYIWAWTREMTSSILRFNTGYTIMVLSLVLLSSVQCTGKSLHRIISVVIGFCVIGLLFYLL